MTQALRLPSPPYAMALLYDVAEAIYSGYRERLIRECGATTTYRGRQIPVPTWAELSDDAPATERFARVCWIEFARDAVSAQADIIKTASMR